MSSTGLVKKNWPQGYKTEHEISTARIKTEMLKNEDFYCFQTLNG